MIVPRGSVVDDRVMVIGASGRVESRPVGVSFYIESEHSDLVPGETQWAVLEGGLEPGRARGGVQPHEAAGGDAG